MKATALLFREAWQAGGVGEGGAGGLLRDGGELGFAAGFLMSAQAATKCP